MSTPETTEGERRPYGGEEGDRGGGGRGLRSRSKNWKPISTKTARCAPRFPRAPHVVLLRHRHQVLPLESRYRRALALRAQERQHTIGDPLESVSSSTPSGTNPGYKRASPEGPFTLFTPWQRTALDEAFPSPMAPHEALGLERSGGKNRIRTDERRHEQGARELQRWAVHDIDKRNNGREPGQQRPIMGPQTEPQPEDSVDIGLGFDQQNTSVGQALASHCVTHEGFRVFGRWNLTSALHNLPWDTHSSGGGAETPRTRILAIQ